MRIFVDAHVFDGKPQGTVSYLKGIYGALVSENKENIQYYFAARDIDNLKSKFGTYNNVNYIKLRFNNKFLRLLFEYPYLISKLKIDYAHFQYISPLLKTSKIILTVHDLIFMDFPQYYSIKFRIKNTLLFWISAIRADVLLTVSEYSKKRISKRFFISQSKINVIPNGYNPNKKIEHINVKIKYQLRDYILYVSRFEPRKNHIMLLKLFFEESLFNNYDLVFIGAKDLDVPEFNSYFTKLDSMKKQHVKFFSFISDLELSNFYGQCALFVYPSFAEGFGIPPLEAYLTGAKVVCSNSTAMSDFEFLQNSFFDPHDKDDFKKIVLDIIDEPRNINHNDISKIRDKYNWNNIAKQFLNILRLDG